MREFNFDGLVGPTHNYAGLSRGNIASQGHQGQVASPLRAALQGLAKMRFVASLGVGQAVLPPQERPSLGTLRALGFRGSDEAVLAQAASTPEGEHLLRLCSSAASMWAANAATAIPSADAADGRLHLVPANLTAMFHRAIEATQTERVLRKIFPDPARVVVHAPLPGGDHFGDEGAANHTRLITPGRAAVHLFSWGRTAFGSPGQIARPRVHPARQTLQASQALARLGQLAPGCAVFPQQDPLGIDAGAFHSDVLAVGSAGLLLVHERAFVDARGLLLRLRSALGEAFEAVLATEEELPLQDAVAAYPFNSALVQLPDATLALIAPEEAQENPRAWAFLQRALSESHCLTRIHALPLRESMDNGGGPACLRLRVGLTDAERASAGARVFWDEALGADLGAWVTRHYRDRLSGDDLRDPLLHRESLRALDELTQLLALGSVYDFQRAA